jgi:hypothetical protein
VSVARVILNRLVLNTKEAAIVAAQSIVAKLGTHCGRQYRITASAKLSAAWYEDVSVSMISSLVNQDAQPERIGKGQK